MGVSKAVILVAGKSTRTYPLTVTKPKALLKIGNQTMLSLLLDNLVGTVKEAILIVNYKKEMIKKAFGNKYKSIKLTYVHQTEAKGTGHALEQAESHLKEESFIMFYGDDYIEKKDVQKLCKEKHALLCAEVEDPTQYGILEVNKKMELLKIEEKPAKPKTKLTNVGYYIFTKEIFDHLKKVKKSMRGEYELTDAVTAYTKVHPMKVIKSSTWIPITYPWHLLDANKKYLESTKFVNQGKIEPRVTIHGQVNIGKGTIVRSGAYIEGPVIIGEDCKIGPNCYIRPSTTLGNKVKIGNAVEVKNSIIGDNTSVGHLSYLGDSVIGDNVNFGAGTIVANLRHDNENMKSAVGKNLTDTGRRKLGVIIGDNVHTGIHTSIYPGRKLWPHTTTAPGEIVKKDKQ
jgi:UDP-N-acetylglucosamine diphosphorylase / glucose-1-phosphate thymidylyltransferase / UDP-N-acetylgalactosamine diphosphorylase / glucosamine-1-phosphate N-acetyltransferase / galactosamine-1-phosphate N-acetyltransferase